MADDGEETERDTVPETPATVDTGNAGWWIAAAVALVAVVGLFFLFTAQNRESELQAARQQGATQASLDAVAAETRAAAAQAHEAAQAEVTSRTTRRAAEAAAQAAADQTTREAQYAGQAAQDAAATAPAPQQ
jgi:hypothetical protein